MAKRKRYDFKRRRRNHQKRKLPDRQAALERGELAVWERERAKVARESLRRDG